MAGKVKTNTAGFNGGVQGKPSQNENQFYRTQRPGIVSLLKAERFDRDVWECCCGDGAVSRVLEEAGYDVHSTDLVDRGYGQDRGPHCDVLSFTQAPRRTVVTNPPFPIAADMVRHLLSIGVEEIALLLKVNYWNVGARIELFRETRPAKVYMATFRMDFSLDGPKPSRRKKGDPAKPKKKNAPMMDIMWCIWRAGHQGLPEMDLLAKPADDIMLAPRSHVTAVAA